MHAEPGEAIRLRRDELGIKPVYYVQDGSGLAYGDHITPLLKVLSDRQPDKNSIKTYLEKAPYVNSEDTFFKGLKRLLPGHELTFNLAGRVVSRPYWVSHFSTRIKGEIDIHVVAGRTLDLLLEAVASSVGDETQVIGAALSGGLDSSSVVACISKLRPHARIKTFSVIADENCDDARHSKIVANEFGTEHIIVTPDAEEFWNELHDFVRCQEEPVNGIGAYCDWKMHERAKNEGLRRLLGGSGSDALLLGHESYLPHYWLTLLNKKEYAMLLSNLLGFYDVSLGLISHNFIPFLKDRMKTAPVISQALSQQTVENLLAEDVAFNLSERSASSLPSDLRQLYNNATYFGIEPQSPFLYLPLVEYSAALPLDCKIRDGYTKYVLREAMKPLLPDKILRRRSKGVFADPASQWFNGPLREKLHDFFFTNSLKGTEYYDLDRVHRILTKKMQNSECAYVWRVLNLEVWLQEFF